MPRDGWRVWEDPEDLGYFLGDVPQDLMEPPEFGQRSSLAACNAILPPDEQHEIIANIERGLGR